VPALVAALEKDGIEKGALADLRGKYGDAVVHALDLIIGNNRQQTRAAAKLVVAAEQIASHPAVKNPLFAKQLIDAIASGRLENLKGLKNILQTVIPGELKHPDGPQYGTLNVLTEVITGIQAGKTMGLEGRKVNPRDARSGEADLINYTDKEVIQNKVVTGGMDRVVKNIVEAINQLNGVNGEIPPAGYSKTVRIVLGGAQPMRQLTRPELVKAIRTSESFRVTPIVVPTDIKLIILNDASGAAGFSIASSDFEGSI
jgi:hypothetical protein